MPKRSKPGTRRSSSSRLPRRSSPRQLLAEIVESSQDAIVAHSVDGIILTWNRAAQGMFGWSPEEAVGSPVRLIVPPEAEGQAEEVVARLLRGEPAPPFEAVRLTRGGERVTVSAAMSALRDARGRVVTLSATFRDITELQRVQASLRKEGIEKDRFLAVLSHELRNPLAPLLSSIEILRESGDSKEIRNRSLAMMDRQLHQLTGLVDQLMDAARISSGKIRLDLADLDLGQLVQEVVDDHRALIDDAGLVGEVSIPRSAVMVRADRLRVAQVVGNLLSNALKFTPRGGTIVITVAPDPRAGRALVTVSDTGVGLESGTEEDLFRPFAQGPITAVRGRGGLGLGLALVRGLVDSHGGTIEARSGGPGQGTTFTFDLPMPPVATAPALPPARPRRARRRRVLLVEDNLDSSESLRMLIDLWGHDVQVAFDAFSGLDRIRAFKPEVVFCDLKLGSDVDGIALAEAIRADHGLRQPFLVALTGFGQPADQEQTRAAGFDRHITKPAEPDTIRQLIEDAEQ